LTAPCGGANLSSAVSFCGIVGEWRLLSGSRRGDEYRFIESRVIKGGSMALSFATDIRPLFRDEDIDCMKPMGIDLDDPAWMCVPANAQDVYRTVSDGSMPPDEPWPADRVSLFKKWIDAGCPA
jgi:hypothetical protein